MLLLGEGKPSPIFLFSSVRPECYGVVRGSQLDNVFLCNVFLFSEVELCL